MQKNLESGTVRARAEVRPSDHRRLLFSAAPLMLALVSAPPALAQSVTGGGDLNQSPIQTPDWVVAGDLIVGVAGPGTLTIEDGGTVENDTGYVGDGAAGQGTVTVSGQGGGQASTWTNNSLLAVGQSGTGTLTIEDGGLVTSQYSYVGADPTGDGTVTVRGRGADGVASTWTNGDLHLGDLGIGRLIIENGGTVSNAYVTIGGGGPGVSSVTVSGRDALGVSTWTSSGPVYVGASSTGSLRVDGGALMNSDQGIIGGEIGSPGVGTGSVVIAGTDGAGAASTWNSANLYVGAYSNGSLTIEDGGVVNTTGAGYVGYDGAGTGTLIISSSTGDISTWDVSNEITVGFDGDGDLTIDKGGTVVVGANVVVARNGGAIGTLSLLGDASGRGVLESSSVDKGLGAATLELDGGVLRATWHETDFLAGFDALTIGGEGAWFDTNGYDIAVLTDFAGGSSLNKLGLGRLTLAGDSTAFTGATTVFAGKLLVGETGAPAVLGGDVDVRAGAALGGIGNIGGNVGVAGSGVLSPGGSTAPGTLTIAGDLTLSGASVLNYRLGQAGTVGGALNDLLVVGGALTLDGTLNVSVSPGGTFGPGVYRLINYTGALTNAGLNLGSLPAGGSHTLQTSIANQVNLVRTASPGGGGGGDPTPPVPPPPPPPPPPGPFDFWDGAGGVADDGAIQGGDGIWRVGGPNSWTQAAGATNGSFSNGVFAIFAAKPGLVAVDGGAGPVAISGMQFASDGYRLSGDAITLQAGDAVVRVGDGTAAGAGFTATIDAALSGPGRLDKTDLGTLILSGTSSHTGGTRISSGTLQVDGKVGGVLDISPGARLSGAGQVGATSNQGVIAPGSGGFGTLTIAGDYAGLGGRLEIEAELGGDHAPADRLVVTGASSGLTPVTVTNLGGQGAATGRGMLVVQVDGVSSGQFALANGDYSIGGRSALVAGAYGYVLERDAADGDWYLRSALPGAGAGEAPGGPDGPRPPLFQPGAPVFEAYANVLLSLSEASTLRQRVGDRRYDAADVDRTGVWGRIEGRTSHLEPSVSATDVQQDTDSWKIQFGVDRVLSGGEGGARLVGGLNVQLGAADTRLSSVHGGGEIDIDVYGIGAAMTWHGPGGGYLDAQAQAAWFASELTSSLTGRQASGQDGHGFGVSLEAGKTFILGTELSVTPQAQLSYASTDFDSFSDRFGARVDSDRGESLQGRAGAALDHARAWQDASGQRRRLSLYGLFNLKYEFLDGARVLVSGTPFDSRQGRTWGGLAAGADYSWADGRYALYGQAAADTGLSSIGESYAVTGGAGFRMRF